MKNFLSIESASVAELHAWVDESGSNRDLDPNTYVLAAALSPECRR